MALERAHSPNGPLQYWGGSARAVWWVPQPIGGEPPAQCHAMTRREGDTDIWELDGSIAQTSAGYALLVESRQSLRHRGACTRFGQPDDEDAMDTSGPAESTTTGGLTAFDETGDPGCSPSGVDSAMSTDASGEVDSTGDEECTEAEEVRLARELGRAEMVLLASDVACFAAEAEGVRFTLVVAHRVVVEDVEASIAAGGGVVVPVPFRRAQQIVTPGDPDHPLGVWIGELHDFSLHDDTELRLEVMRREWRMDPYALAVSKNMGFCSNSENLALSDGTGKHAPAVVAPPGPEIWSVATAAPAKPPAAFARCADRQLVLYELHVGSFTQEGTFSAAAARLEHIRSLGCTAISLMPVHQDLRRLENAEADWWGYDIISFIGLDTAYGKPADLFDFIERAHQLGLAVIVDYVVNHMVWGAEKLLGPHFFLEDQTTVWGPRPDFKKAEVRAYACDAAQRYLVDFGFDGLRVDSTKSIRKFPDGSPDSAGMMFLSELTSLCRRLGKLAIAEDLEDGDGVLQFGGLGFHMQWDMAMFCWVYDALVHPMDEFRNLGQVAKGLAGLSPGRAHALRGRVVFMESHDTATSDRYGRVAAAVHNGKAFMACANDEAGGDAFQKADAAGVMPYPEPGDVDDNPYAVRRAALGLVLVLTAPGVPMVLQGQELGDCRPYKWPRGPAMDWRRVDNPTNAGTSWFHFCRDLIKVRQQLCMGGARATEIPALLGDGLHVFYCEGGVLAYLRWAGEPADSRECYASSPELALVVVNCTHSCFPSYMLGVPPSQSWRPVLSSASVARLNTDPDSVFGAKAIATIADAPNHGFPCSVDVSLPPYAAIVLLRQA